MYDSEHVHVALYLCASSYVVHVLVNREAEIDDLCTYLNDIIIRHKNVIIL